MIYLVIMESFQCQPHIEDETGCKVGRDWSENVGLSTTAYGSG